MRYIEIILAGISVIILAILGCNNFPTSPKDELLSATTSKNTYSEYDRITLNICNNTQDSVYFEFYDNTFIAIFEKISYNNWIQANLIYRESDAILNARLLSPDSSMIYKKRVYWTGKSRIIIPYNIDGSLNFPDTLISNTFTIE